MAAVSTARSNVSFHPRSSTNASAPATSATAPVLEFRCTFTQEGYKKAPKFHDGYITYHTFNRVIVLYDDTRRKVSSLHYRNDEEVEEGVRLTFDRSVLVDVAEPAGQTQTDLGQVLIQRNSPDRRATVAPRNTRVAAASQGRPRSLRDVLGASQGPIGRARLPSQTPFEQRQTEVGSHPDQPPAKRLKVATGKENLPLAEKHVSAQEKLPSTDVPKAIRTSWAPGSTQDAVGRVEEVHELSSDDDVPIARARLSKQATPARLPQIKVPPLPPVHGRQTPCNDIPADSDEFKSPKASKQPKTLNSAHEKSGPVREALDRKKDSKQPKAAKAAKEKPRATNDPALRTQAVSLTSRNPSTIASDHPSHPAQSSKATPRVYTPRPGTSQLQLSKEKPRPKLMCRALIPSLNADTIVPKPASAIRSGSSSSGGNSDVLRHRRRQSLEQADRGNSAQENLVPSVLQEGPQPGLATVPSTPPKQQELPSAPIAIDSSPLFVSQNEPSPPSPSQHLEEDDDLEVSMLEIKRPPEPGDSSDYPISLSPKPESHLPSLNTRGPFVEDNENEGPDPVHQQNTQEKMPPPPRPFLAPTTTISTPPTFPSPIKTPGSSKKPFRRVLSENDASAAGAGAEADLSFPSLLPDADFPPTAALVNKRHSPIRRNNSNMAPPPPPHPSRSLRRTLSDPVVQPNDSDNATSAHITSFNVDPVVAEASGKGETGPWTADEAWLLFDINDHWPEAKKGLVPEWAKQLAAAGGDRVAAGRGGGKVVQVTTNTTCGSGFSSARGLLYEHTAQGTGVLRDEIGAM